MRQFLKVFFLVLCSCIGNSTTTENNLSKLYSEILSELLDTNYYIFCLDKLHNDKLEITTNELNKIKNERKASPKKCIISYSQDFRSDINHRDILVPEWFIDKPFFLDNFNVESITDVLNSISSSTRLDTSSLNVKYMEIEMYNKDKKSKVTFDESIGVISFSKVYFSKDTNRGILYYEFECGIKCGDGVILFIEKIDYQWSINQRLTVWNK